MADFTRTLLKRKRSAKNLDAPNQSAPRHQPVRRQFNELHPKDQNTKLNRKVRIETNWGGDLQDCIPLEIRPRVELKKGAKARVGDAHRAEEVWWNWSVEILRGLEELSTLTARNHKFAQELLTLEVKNRQSNPKHPQRKLCEVLLGDVQRVVDNLRRSQAQEAQMAGSQDVTKAEDMITRYDEERQPADGEKQPADGEEQPADREEQPANGEEQPANGEEQPAIDEGQEQWERESSAGSPQHDFKTNMETPTQPFQPSQRFQPFHPFHPIQPIQPIPAQGLGKNVRFRAPATSPTAMSSISNSPAMTANHQRQASITHLSMGMQINSIEMRARATRLRAQAIRLEAEAADLETEAAVMRTQLEQLDPLTQG